MLTAFLAITCVVLLIALGVSAYLNYKLGKIILRLEDVIEESLEEVHDNIREEAADTLQNLLLICSRFNITTDELLKEVQKKNQKWKEQIPKRQAQRTTI